METTARHRSLLGRGASSHPDALPPTLPAELWAAAGGERCPLSPDELWAALEALGTRLNHNRPPGETAAPTDRAVFFRSLRLEEFALAQACALGRDDAWRRFDQLYRGPVLAAAIGIAGNGTAGHELADALMADLFGLRTAPDGTRRSPLAGFSGRGSLLGWLRSTLAQRHVDRHRRQGRETALADLAPAEQDPAAAPSQPMPAPAELSSLAAALARTLRALPAEDRFLLAGYFLDRQTLHALGRTLRVHEATVSRRIHRLTAQVRGALVRELERTGLSRRAAEERLETDPRDLEINLRAALQSAGEPAFSPREGDRA